MDNQLTPEQIEKNWTTYCSFFDKLGERSEAAKRLLEAVGQSLASAPASSKTYYHLAHPGGLVQHSLNVLRNALKLNKTFEWNLPQESLIIGALLHDLGKACHVFPDGTTIDHYVVNDSDWHRDRGQPYKYNQDEPFMTVPDRGVWLCNQYGLKLTYEEFVAIRCNDGMYVPENHPYMGKEPLLATCIHLADYISTISEKQEQREFERENT